MTPSLDFMCWRTCNKVARPASRTATALHGPVYGNAKNVTEMTEWRRVNPESDEHAELVAMSKYSLGPGQTKAYGPDVIHSTAHPERAWVIRVTGTDLDHLPRYRFGTQDRILESA